MTIQRARRPKAMHGVLLAALVAALPAFGGAQGSDQLLIDITGDHQPQHRIPSVPIFFGQAYEGTLSPENGMVRQQYRNWGTHEGDFNVAYFDIDLLEGDVFSYGLTTDGPDLLIDLFRFDPARGEAGEWVWGVQAAHGAHSNGCITGMKAGATGRHRIRLSTMKPDTVARYSFHLLPRAKPIACRKQLDEATREFLDTPPQPASLQVARTWEGRERVRRFRMPDAFVQADTPEAIAYARSKPAGLQSFYKALYLDGEHNAVLNFQRLGLAAMELGAFGEAEWAFDQALARIETIYGQTSIAKAARSKWTPEGIKDYRGEPYERAMAYYYRGLLYLRAGDYENARASFISGEFQDTLSQAEEFQGDFALMNWLAGWSSYCLGDQDRAAEAFSAALRVSPGMKSPASENTLLVADLGRGPVKMARGQESKLLTFAQPVDSGRGERVAATISGVAQPLGLDAYADLYFQATTRGGRAIDAILDGKAALRSTMGRTMRLGETLVQAGASELGVAGLVIALVSAGVGGQVESEADVRVWDTLPDSVAVGLANAAPTAAATFEVTGSESGSIQPTSVMRAHNGRCGIAWSRSRSSRDAPIGAPGNDVGVARARSKNSEAVALDAAFRKALIERDTAAL